MKFLITTLEIYQKVFWDLDDEVAKLINERQLKSFLQKWNKVVEQITKIHQKLDDAKRLTRNISIEKWRIDHHRSQFSQAFSGFLQNLVLSAVVRRLFNKKKKNLKGFPKS
jgi:predicted CopG family antitoxin